MDNYIRNNLEPILRIKSLISAFEVVYEPDFYFDGESHNFWEFVYVVDGQAGITADDKILELSKGQIVFHKPMEFHRLWSSNATNPHLVISSFVAEGEGMNSFENGVFQLNLEHQNLLNNIMNDVNKIFFIKDYSRIPKEENPIIKQLIANNLELLLLKILEEKKPINTLEESKSANNYNRIINVMNENLYKNLTVDNIAKLSNLSTSNLKKTFKKYSGYGVMEYFINMKILKASKLLMEGYSVAEISEMLAFSSQYYFSAVFKRITGYAPIVYKKIYK